MFGEHVQEKPVPEKSEQGAAVPDDAARWVIVLGMIALGICTLEKVAQEKVVLEAAMLEEIALEEIVPEDSVLHEVVPDSSEKIAPEGTDQKEIAG